MPQFYDHLITGLLCAGVEYSIFMAVDNVLGWGLIPANALAYTLVFISNFLPNKISGFAGTKQLRTQYQFIPFGIVAL